MGVIGDLVDADGVYHALPDPIDDRMFATILALAAEVWTVRDRLRLVESALQTQGLSIDSVIRSAAGEPEELERMAADRDAFVARVLAPVMPRRQPTSA